jgi:hypothetical protein
MLRARERVPNSLLFYYFHLKLTFEPIKELGSESSGADQGPIKGSIFGGLHVLLPKFYSSLTHQKVVEGVRLN